MRISKTQLNILTLLIITLSILGCAFNFGSIVSAAPNYQINYQGKLTDSANVAVPDGTYNMRFWLIASSTAATSTAVWTESLTGSNRVQVTSGLFSVMLGSTSVLTSVDFNQTLYLGVEIGSSTVTAQWDGEMSPRKILGTVPAAFEADRLDGLTSSQFVRSDTTATIASTSASTLLTVTQNGTGDIFNIFDGAAEVFSILDGGNVGIGSSTPSRLLTVAGDIIGANLTATGTLTVSGTTTLATTTFSVATSTNLYTTTLGVGTDYITDLTGTGITNTAGALTASLGTDITAAEMANGDHGFFTYASNVASLDTGGLTSANLLSALTDETGTGNVVFSATPIFTGTIQGAGMYLTGSSTLGYASSTALSGTNAYLTYASTTGLTATNVTINGETFSDLTGSGLSLVNGVLTATGGSSNWLYQNSALTPSTTVGLRVNASSTIGDGTGAGGLTVYGGATTTGNAYFAGNVGIGTVSALEKLEVNGNILADNNSYVRNSLWSSQYRESSNSQYNPLANALNGRSTGAVWEEAGTSTLPAGIWGHTALVFDGKMWVIGGYTTSEIRKVYSSSDGITWTEAGSDALPVATSLHTSVVYDGKMWVIGGNVGGPYTRKVYYSTNGSTWTEAGSDAIPFATQSHTSVVYDGKMWVIAGTDTGSTDRKVYYSTNGSTWTEAGTDSFPTAISSHTSLVYDGKMWVIGGYTGSNTRKVYSSTDGITWTEAGTDALPVGTQAHASLVYDGKMWVISGIGNSAKIRYSSDGITWTEAGTNASPLQLDLHSALVYDGEMWIIGGEISGGRSKKVYRTIPTIRGGFAVTNSGSTTVFTILANGNVGIGSSTPSRTLTVSGDIYTLNNIFAASSTLGFASSTALTVSGNSIFNFASSSYASTTGLTATNAFFNIFTANVATSTNLYTTTLGVGTDYITDLTGTGITNTAGALTASLGTDITAAEIANGDHGFFSYSSNVASLDTGGLTSANLLSALTDETGTGNVVFSATPIFTGTIQGAGMYLTGSSTLGYASSSALTVSGQTYLANASSTGGISASALYGAIFGTTGNFSSTLNVTGQTTLATASSTGLTATNLYATIANTLGTTTLATVSGNVGIGTTSPLTKLQVDASGANKPGVLITDGISAVNNYRIGSYNSLLTLNIKDAVEAYQLAYINEAAGKIANYQTDSNHLLFYHSRINDVSSGYNYILNTGGLAFVRSGGLKGIYEFSDTKIGIGGVDITTPTSSTPILLIDTGTGNVGVGSSTPSRRLTVAGDIIGANLTATGTLTVSGNTSLAAASSTNFNATAFGVGSDYITDLTGSGLSIVNGALTATGGSSNWLYQNSALTPSTTVGLRVNASSTIGDGTGAGGLTVYGGATTTGALTVSGNTSLQAATSTNFNTTAFGVGSDRITDLTGSSLTITNGALGVATSTFFTNSAQFAQWLSDETGTGNVVFSATPIFTGTIQGAGMYLTGSSTLGYASTTALSVSGNGYFSGKVGIGSTTPNSILSIGNTIGTTANTPLFTIASTTAGTATSTHFSVLANGNVGIGTSNPSGRLAVSSANISQTWAQVGTSTSISSVIYPALAMLSPNRVAFINGDGADASLRVYDWNGTTWVQIGNSLTFSGAGGAGISALSPNRVAVADNGNTSLSVYEFNGTTWVLVGSSLSISGMNAAALTTLSPNRIALTDDGNNLLRTYEFNGSIWYQVGSGLSISISGVSSLAALSPNRIVLSEVGTESLTTYEFDGATWRRVGNSLSVSGAIGYPSLAVLSPNRIALANGFSPNGTLRVFEFNGSEWTSIVSTAVTMARPTIAALSPNRVAFIDADNDQLRIYQFSSPLLNIASATDFPYLSVSDAGYTTAEELGVRTTLTVGQSATSTQGTSSPAFIVNGTSVFSGLVGLGTTSPVAQLTILGNRTSSMLFAVASSTANGLATTTDYLFNISSSGNIGIGSTTPSRKLTVWGDGYFLNNITAASSTFTNASTTYLSATNFNTGFASSSYASTTGLTATNAYLNSLTLTCASCITDANVSDTLTASAVAVGGITGLGTGVGTWLATPSSANLATALTDETGTGNVVFSATPIFTGTIQGAGMYLTGSSTLGYASTTALTVSGNSYFNFASSSYASTTGLTATNAFFGGNVGIATSSLAKFAINNGSNNTHALWVEGGGSTNSSVIRLRTTSNSSNPVFEWQDSSPGQSRGASFNYLDASENAVGQIAYQFDTTGTNQYMALRVNLSERLRIDGSGRVGIASTTPSRTLTVGGDIYGANIISAGTLTVSGNTSLQAATSTNFNTTAFGVGSDYITDLTGTGLSIVNGALTASGGASNWLYQNSALTPSTTVGLRVNASSTIGDGTGAGGLTVYGGATTTGALVVSGNTSLQAATSTNMYATTLGIGTDYITDLTGTGITNTAGALTASLGTDITAAEMANGDHGFFSYSSNVASLDTGGLTSANLLSALTDETGTGNVVFSATPIFTGTIQGAGMYLTGSSTLGYASSSALTVSGNTFLTYASSTGISGTNATFSNSVLGYASSTALTVSGDTYLNGLVGIGSTTPNAVLTIASTTSSGTLFRVGTTTNANLFNIFGNGKVTMGTTSADGIFAIDRGGLTGGQVAGIKESLRFVNGTESAVYYGDNAYIINAPTATSTLVGKIIRVEDSTGLGNTVRGLEVQAHRGTTTKGENTGISAFGRTFGLRGTTEGDAGATFIPAGVYAESRGTTQGNALRAYSGTITTSNLAYLFHDTSAFTGTGLLMNFGNASGSFTSTSSAKFMDFQVAGTSKFTVTAAGTTTIGDGTTLSMAGLQIGYGGLCVDNDGSCQASTTGRITSVSSAVGNSDLAEMYFSQDDLEAGDIVMLDGGLSVTRATEDEKQNIVGVISTKPGLVMGQDDSPLISGQSGYPVALKGRVPVRLSTENGAIQKGDRIALSSIPGIGMKATESDVVVGIALEDYAGEVAYTAGYLNQFGDDLVKAKAQPRYQNTDTRTQDGCSYGAGNEEGAAPCVKDAVVAIKPETISIDNRTEIMNELRQEDARVMATENGETVAVGQALMFVHLDNYVVAEEQNVLAELLATTTNGANEDETLWDRLKTLATNFVDGVLQVAGLRTNELCVGNTCVDEETFLRMVQSATVNESDTDTDGGAPDPQPEVESPPDTGGGTEESPPTDESITENPPDPTLTVEEEQIPEEPVVEEGEVTPEPAPEESAPAPEEGTPSGDGT